YADQIWEFVQHEPHNFKLYAWSDGASPLGTAGALRHIPVIQSQPFFVLYGDVFPLCNFQVIQEKFELYTFPALMVIYRTDHHGNVDYNNRTFHAYNKFKPTPAMTYGDYGLSMLQPSVLSVTDSSDLADVFAALDHNMVAFEAFEKPYSIGSFASLERTRAFLRARS